MEALLEDLEELQSTHPEFFPIKQKDICEFVNSCLFVCNICKKFVIIPELCDHNDPLELFFYDFMKREYPSGVMCESKGCMFLCCNVCILHNMKVYVHYKYESKAFACKECHKLGLMLDEYECENDINTISLMKKFIHDINQCVIKK